MSGLHHGADGVGAVAIIGAGFGGLAVARALQQAGIENFTIFEKAADLGGTWRENTYPGAACDVPSHLYAYSFERHWPWSHRYAKQPQILQYIQHCADKYGWRRHIRFNQEVTGADWDETAGLWRLNLADGSHFAARMLVSSVGQLHRPSIPDIPGRESFAGTCFHSARWDHRYDFHGKRVAVIGTGASAVQFVPAIAPQVQQLHLFQRSPGWVAPKFEKPFSRFELGLLKALPFLVDLDRARIFALLEFLGYSYRGHKFAEQIPTLLAKTLLRVQVSDTALRQRLTPDYAIGCKRILLSTDWLPALCRTNVEVVDTAIAAIEPEGVRDAQGRMRKVDVIIWGTGFAATEFLAPMQVRGRAGHELSQDWKRGAQAYLGMAVSGFPNFFVQYGPNTNLGSGSIIYMLEKQAGYIAQMASMMQNRALHSIEVRAEAQAGFVAMLRKRSAGSTYASDCQSWYKNAAGINTNNWVGSMLEYGRLTHRPVLDDYLLTGAASGASGASHLRAA